MKPMLFAAVAYALTFITPALGADPLPSWNDTAPKKAIAAFVEKVTKEGSPDFVPAPERIATFDNYGTLWAERPMDCRPFQGQQFLFSLDIFSDREILQQRN